MCHFARLAKSLGFVFCFSALLGQENMRGNYRPLEDALMDAEAARDITTVQLQSLPIDAPLLRLAYCNLFLGESNGQFDAREMRAECIVSLADIRRRGETVTPLLLDMLDKNRDTFLEGSILNFAPGIKTFGVEPFLEYARTAVRTRALTLNSANAGSMAALLASHGSESDLELLKRFVETRPYLSATISSHIKVLEQRLASVGSTSNPSQVSTRPPLATGRTQTEQDSASQMQGSENNARLIVAVIDCLNFTPPRFSNAA